jgi:hypothetical protein
MLDRLRLFCFILPFAGMLVTCQHDSAPPFLDEGSGPGDAVATDTRAGGEADHSWGDGVAAGDSFLGDDGSPRGDAVPGDSSAAGDGAGASVGALCVNDHDCESELCWLTIPGGYCTVDCDGAIGCPAGSVRARVYVGGSYRCRCMRSCLTKSDCSYRDFECHFLGYDNDGVCNQPF